MLPVTSNDQGAVTSDDHFGHRGAGLKGLRPPPAVTLRVPLDLAPSLPGRARTGSMGRTAKEIAWFQQVASTPFSVTFGDHEEPGNSDFVITGRERKMLSREHWI